MKTFSFLVFALSSLSLFANVEGKFKCSLGEDYSFENIQIEVQADCSVKIKSNDNIEAQEKNRIYTFTPEGKFIVSILTRNNQKLSSELASNSFKLIPKKILDNKLEYNFNKSLSYLMLTTASGLQVEVNTKQLQVLNIEGYRLTTRPLVKTEELIKLKGNINITAYENNLVLNDGFQFGTNSKNKI